MKNLAFISDMPVSIWIADNSAKFIYFNKNCLEFVGISLEQAIGEAWFERIHPEDVKQYRKVYSEAFSERLSYQIEYRVRCHDVYCWIMENAKPLYEADGSFIGYSGLFYNISERKEMEIELKQSRDRYKSLFNNAQAGLYRTRISDGMILECNERFARILGFDSPKELINSYTIAEHYVDPGTRQRMLEELKKTDDLGKFEARFFRKDGTICWARYTVHLNRNEGYLEGVLIDITEEKRAEEELRKLSRAVDQSPVIVLITDVNGVIEYVNPKFTQITGYLPEEVMGKSPRILKSGKMPEEIYKELWNTITSGNEWRGELVNKKKDGEFFWGQVSISPIKDCSSVITHFVAVAEDITEQKSAQEIIQHQAFHDTLTGLPNRAMFNEMLSQAVAQAYRNKHELAVMFMDLDRFKLVNDTLGHAAGDEFLKKVAENIKKTLRKGDIFARLGGDEFTLILPMIKNKRAAAAVAKKIIDIFKAPTYIDGYEFDVTISVGISIYPYDGLDSQSLMVNADNAMYYAKENGRNRYSFYDSVECKAAPWLDIKGCQKIL